MLKLRTIGIRDYSVLEGEQRIGRIRFASERNPGIWIWAACRWDRAAISTPPKRNSKRPGKR